MLNETTWLVARFERFLSRRTRLLARKRIPLISAPSLGIFLPHKPIDPSRISRQDSSLFFLPLASAGCVSLYLSSIFLIIPFEKY